MEKKKLKYSLIADYLSFLHILILWKHPNLEIKFYEEKIELEVAVRTSN